MSNGLDKLNGMRTRGSGVRRMPAPRNGPRATPVDLTASGDEGQAGRAAPPAQEPAASPAPTPAAPVAVAPSEPTPAPKADRQDKDELPDKLEKATIYLDAPTDAFLEDVIAAGRRQKPRVDSRSAIVRLALRELANKMSPEEVVTAIRATSTKAGPGTQGRPRL